MKKFAILLTGVFLVLGVAGAATASPMWAADVKWVPGDNVSLGSDRANPDNALGAPDADVNDEFLSLGLGGFAIFDFDKDFHNSAGIYEMTWGNRSGYVENAEIYVAGSDFDFYAFDPETDAFPSDDFTIVTDITNDDWKTVIDLSGLADSAFSYLAILDTTEGSGKDGFDVDAVGVDPVPEPGTILLLGFGLVGVYAANRRRSAKS
jgi:hypothetical protein